jgi:hypothetical protein
MNPNRRKGASEPELGKAGVKAASGTRQTKSPPAPARTQAFEVLHMNIRFC